jgi:SAM-dependent methyltransferase
VANSYTPTWFETYLKTYNAQFTEIELAFLMRQLPLPAYRTVLDLCCGNGRLALALAARGHEVVGVDRDAAMLAEARARANGIVKGSAHFIQADMREVASVPGAFDAVINMWHSFGYFDAETNADILRQIHGKLNPRGRFILDIFNPEWFAQQLGTATVERDGRQITTIRSRAGELWRVAIDYGPDVPLDTFDWQLYTAAEIEALAEEIGFRPLVQCTWADEPRPITPDDARMQFVFEKA